MICTSHVVPSMCPKLHTSLFVDAFFQAVLIYIFSSTDHVSRSYRNSRPNFFYIRILGVLESRKDKKFSNRIITSISRIYFHPKSHFNHHFYFSALFVDAEIMLPTHIMCREVENILI
jgi:hypothetical protein